MFAVSGRKDGYLSVGIYPIYFILSLFVLTLSYRVILYLFIQSHRVKEVTGGVWFSLTKMTTLLELIDLFEKRIFMG